MADLTCAEEAARDVRQETPFAEYARRCNEGSPKARGLPRGLRVDTSTGAFQVVVREGPGMAEGVLQSLKAAALREGGGVDLFHTESLGEGTSATTTYYEDPAAFYQEQ